MAEHASPSKEHAVSSPYTTCSAKGKKGKLINRLGDAQQPNIKAEGCGGLGVCVCGESSFLLFFGSI